jgi:hypothetical protein
MRSTCCAFHVLYSLPFSGAIFPQFRKTAVETFPL